jgi:arginase
MGPSAIRIAGLAARLRQLGIEVIDDGDLDIRNMEEIDVGVERARFLKEIRPDSKILAQHVSRIMAGGHFPLVLGGDHAIAIGTISGLAEHARLRKKRLGILWVDAHADMNTPATSPSGNIHGMPLAAVLGLGPPELSKLSSALHRIRPRNVALVGIRSVDAGERKHLKSTGVNVYTMTDIDRHGIHRIMRKAIADVTDGTDFFHVSLDLDAVDPTVAPGVGTPVKGGLDYREAHLVMESIAESQAMTSMDVVEVNPVLDAHNISAEFAVELVQSAFGKQIL